MKKVNKRIYSSSSSPNGPSTLQSICSSYPNFFSAALALLKQQLPMKGALVFVAPNGLGCELAMTSCADVPLTRAELIFFVAGVPQSKKTTPLPSSLARLSTARRISSVRSSQPFFLWLNGFAFRTVKTVLSIKTPCFAQRSRKPWVGMVVKFFTPLSLISSLYMLRSDGGILISFPTEKHNPWACFSPWYGSCPTMTTFTLSRGVKFSAEKVSSGGGKIVSFFLFGA